MEVEHQDIEVEMPPEVAAILDPIIRSRIKQYLGKADASENTLGEFLERLSAQDLLFFKKCIEGPELVRANIVGMCISLLRSQWGMNMRGEKLSGKPDAAIPEPTERSGKLETVSDEAQRLLKEATT